MTTPATSAVSRFILERYRDRLPFRFTGRIDHVHFAFGRAAHVTVGEQIEEQLRFD